ncbi:YciI family protein [Nannocystis radixulma]|uniref:YciI family protein n=1 Tax=Nannocystis radixulma TaxID=2995305 RepID=A0ABT5B648_9BACT|nr:YciI family protein [Nannocystis radixulma]MDC0669582.1 YciI family protein [Nannocystis radixulma]
MQFAILCYNDEKVVTSWTQAEDDAVMARLAVVHDRLTAEGKLGPAIRLRPTTSARTLRKTHPPVVLDGPFAETKEQLLGFYIVNCETSDEVLDIARELAIANPGGSYEVRPISLFLPGHDVT